jgi:hypothetical protein
MKQVPWPACVFLREKSLCTLHWKSAWQLSKSIKSIDLYRNVRLAEWSKAPDLSSGNRKIAWVRTPHLTKFFYICLTTKSKEVSNLYIWGRIRLFATLHFLPFEYSE